MTDNGHEAVTTFEDLMPPDVIPIHIETGYGRRHTVMCGVLSYDEWQAARRKIPMPKVPKTRPDPSNAEKLLPNPDDPAYIDQMREWNDNSVCYQVVVSLEKAGMKIPGDKPLDKARNFRKMDNALLNAIVDGVTQAHSAKKAKVETLANSFREQSMVTPEDDGDVEMAYPNGNSMEQPTRE